jgi:hypothetical protein
MARIDVKWPFAMTGPKTSNGTFQMASVAEIPRVIVDPFDVFRGGTKVHRVT